MSFVDVETYGISFATSYHESISPKIDIGCQFPLHEILVLHSRVVQSHCSVEQLVSPRPVNK
jgi:hypothetical protein